MEAPITAPIAQMRLGPPTLNVGKAWRRAAETIRRHALALLVVSLVVIAAPAAAVQWLSILDRQHPRDWPLLVVYYAASLGFEVIGAGFLAWVALLAADDATDAVAPVARFGSLVAMAPAIVATAVIYWLSVYAAMILLLVPGLMLATAWSVSLPALAVERLGPVTALRRSLALTRGNRWSIFGPALVVWIASTGMYILAAKIFGGGASLVVAFRMPLFAYVIGPIVNTLREICLAALLAAIYVELAGLDGHTSSARVAEVFA